MITLYLYLAICYIFSLGFFLRMSYIMKRDGEQMFDNLGDVFSFIISFILMPIIIPFALGVEAMDKLDNEMDNGEYNDDDDK